MVKRIKTFGELKQGDYIYIAYAVSKRIYRKKVAEVFPTFYNDVCITYEGYKDEENKHFFQFIYDKDECENKRMYDFYEGTSKKMAQIFIKECKEKEKRILSIIYDIYQPHKPGYKREYLFEEKLKNELGL